MRTAFLSTVAGDDPSKELSIKGPVRKWICL